MTTMSAEILSGPAVPADAFEFFPGTWTAKMRKRDVDANLRVTSDWSEGTATLCVRRILEGFGYFEEVRMEWPDGVKLAVGCRFYNPATARWTIYWARQTDGAWQEPPMTGGVMVPGGMLFTCEDVWQGSPVLTRYHWRIPSPDHPTWEQSFSNDGGKTWVSQWTFEFSRLT